MIVNLRTPTRLAPLAAALVLFPLGLGVFAPRLRLPRQEVRPLTDPVHLHIISAYAWLVVAATDDRDVNATVSAAAQARRIFSNVVDDPELSSFQVPSIQISAQSSAAW